MADQSCVRLSNKSPYYGVARQFEFMGGATARVPREAINKHPQFAAWVSTQPDDKPINFSDVMERVGHTIVHFLFTGTYQALPTPADDKTKEPSVAFTEALEVYNEATIYCLGKLAKLAIQEIVRQGQDESFASIVKAVDGVDGMLEGEKTWLFDYLISRATLPYEVVTEADIQKLGDMNSGPTLVDILLECIMKLKFQLQHA